MSLRETAAGQVTRLTAEERLIAGGSALFLLLLVGSLFVGWIESAFLVSSLAFAPVYLLGAMALNVQWGYSGLVNFSVVAFFAVGAYSTALLTAPRSPQALELHPAVGLVTAIVLSAVIAVLVGLPTLRLRADYFAIATLGAAEIIRLMLLNEAWLTRGGRGVTGLPVLLDEVPRVPVLSDALAGLSTLPLLPADDPLVAIAELVDTTPRNVGNVVVGFTAVVAVFLLLRRIQSSPWGRVLRTIRADEDIGQALGKNTYRFKLQAFVLGSIIMAVAGFYFAHYFRFTTPSAFVPIETFYVWVAVILGGSGSNRGALLGALTVVVILRGTRLINDRLGDVLSDLLFLTINTQALRLLLIGLLVVLVVRLRPEGLLPPQREHIWPSALQNDGSTDPEQSQ